MGRIAFIDTETISLDPEVSPTPIWEIGLIVDGQEMSWMLEVDLTYADAYALDVGNFHTRHPQGNDWVRCGLPAGRGADGRYPTLTDHHDVARVIAGWTHGCHLVGAVVSFDAERLARLLRQHHIAPSWHYHLVDVEALLAGHFGCEPPWVSSELSKRIGVDPDDYERHTALGDARWCQAMYNAWLLTHEPPV